MRRKGTILLIIWASVATLLVVGLVAYELVRIIGKNNLSSKSVTSSPMMKYDNNGYEMSSSNAVSTNVEWQEDWVRYNGQIYDYNENITTFLIMGIDKSNDVIKVDEGTDGGQADALFLLVLNPDKEKIQVIGINRNTMTDIDIYDEYGSYVTTKIAQIAVQHGFGDGVEKSCEYQVNAVSNLFYQLPIHGYAAINMSAIPTINDAIGGVTVDVLEDLTKWDDSLVKGEKVHLDGESAYNYIRCRDMDAYGSADARFTRQKQYLNLFITTAKIQTEDDPMLVVDIYNSIYSQMTTDITVDELSYLMSNTSGYSFGTDDFISIDGETKMGDKYEEFYVDEDDLYQKIIDVFYEKVEGVN